MSPLLAVLLITRAYYHNFIDLLHMPLSTVKIVYIQSFQFDNLLSLQSLTVSVNVMYNVERNNV